MSQFLTVARAVLERERRPMRPSDIIAYARREGLLPDNIAGKTPHQTLKSKLSVDVRRRSDRSEFVRTKPGYFFLRSLLDEGHTEYAAAPLTKPLAKERVLAFDAEWLPDRDRFQGIRRPWKRLVQKLLTPAVCEYIPRLEAEHNNRYKQVLTYILVRRGDSILAYRRGSYNRVEDYLRGSRCVGFGGHVTDQDRTMFTETGMGIWEAAARELNEELQLPKPDLLQLRKSEGLSLIGVLNDDSSDVGRRHIAFVFEYRVSTHTSWSKPTRAEKSITQLQWLSPGDPANKIWEFEYWSQLCLQEYCPDLVQASPGFRIRRRNVFRRRHALCVIGEVGSGKSETCNWLSEHFNYTHVNTGKVLAKLMGLSPVPKTSRAVFSQRAQQFICKPDGPKRLAKTVTDTIARSAGGNVLIDGIRHRATLDALRPALPRDLAIAILYVYTPPDVAYRLYRSREEELPLSLFLAFRSHPVERDIPEMLRSADAVIYNWTGRSSYHRVLTELMNELLGQ